MVSVRVFKYLTYNGGKKNRKYNSNLKDIWKQHGKDSSTKWIQEENREKSKMTQGFDTSLNKLENCSAMSTSKGISPGKEQIWQKDSFNKYPQNIRLMPGTSVSSGNTEVNKTYKNPCLCGAYILMEEDSR